VRPCGESRIDNVEVSGSYVRPRIFGIRVEVERGDDYAVGGLAKMDID
jgi:hypothetical protein